MIMAKPEILKARDNQQWGEIYFTAKKRPPKNFKVTKMKNSEKKLQKLLKISETKLLKAGIRTAG